MSLKTWWRERMARRRSRLVRKVQGALKPLREFVYLDEVSLRSLLVSQRDTIPEQVTRAISVAEEAELSAKVSADGVVAKGEVGSRYQTTNSNSVQSSRKAIVQTLFNEFHDEARVQYALSDRLRDQVPVASLDDIAKLANEYARAATDLSRGSLVEMAVSLDVEPAFKLGTMMNEFAGMVREFPDVAGPEGMSILHQTEPITKVLDRLLAGLIPIRGTVTNFCVIAISGVEYVVHRDLIRNFDISSRPLTIVGVTEHVGYWKDIRRVLFSGGEFTILCRVGRTGVQASWTPVKLADLFSQVAPDLVDQMSTLGSEGMAAVTAADSPRSEAIRRALSFYVDELGEHYESEFIPLTTSELDDIVEANGDMASPAAQRQAFSAVRALLQEKNLGLSVGDTQDLQARQQARELAALSVIPGQEPAAVRTEQPATSADERLLDVEVIAIYW